LKREKSTILYYPIHALSNPNQQSEERERMIIWSSIWGKIKEIKQKKSLYLNRNPALDRPFFQPQIQEVIWGLCHQTHIVSRWDHEDAGGIQVKLMVPRLQTVLIGQFQRSQISGPCQQLSWLKQLLMPSLLQHHSGTSGLNPWNYIRRPV
jgi:hypothetical protein